MKKVVFNCCCVLSLSSAFSMDRSINEIDDCRKALRSNVVSKISSIESNIDMMRHFKCESIDEDQINTFISNKIIELNHLLSSLKKSDDLLKGANQIEDSIDTVSELRGIIDDKTLNNYITKWEAEYKTLLTKSCSALEN